jgi:Serine/threonine protein kinase
MSTDEKSKEKLELKVKGESVEPASGEDEGNGVVEDVSANGDAVAAEVAAIGVDADDSVDTREAAPSATVRPELPDFGDRYEALEVLGQGGMGTVYKAREKLDKGASGKDTSSGGESSGAKTSGERFVAIKLLQKSLAEDPAALKRFEQEVLSTSKLTHPNLVTVYGMETSPSGAPYLVMDYVEGLNLASALETEGQLEPARAPDNFHSNRRGAWARSRKWRHS